jgi:hypothetical protein
VHKKLDPRKVDPRTVALTGVCEGCIYVLTKWGIPPKIGGRFLKRLERQGCCGSPIIMDYVWMCDVDNENK